MSRFYASLFSSYHFILDPWYEISLFNREMALIDRCMINLRRLVHNLTNRENNVDHKNR